MTNENTERDDLLGPDGMNDDVSAADGTADPMLDPNDEVPVPIAMWPSEIDERAQVVEALRGKGPEPRVDTQIEPEPMADS